MVQINFGQREVSCKLVFYGPGMSGKTTNLEIIHQKAPDNSKGDMVSIATETDRTLYFDYLPLDLGQVAGMHTKFQLYTVPGQIYYNATRKLVLQGVDGVLFVADSGKDKMAENIESLQNLRDNLADMGLSLDELPFVIQYNKRDLPDAMPVSLMDEQLNPMGVPTVEAIARDGKGVFNTLKILSKLVIERLNTEHAPRRRTNDLTPGANARTPTPASNAAQVAPTAPSAPVATPQAAPTTPPAPQPAAPTPQAAPPQAPPAAAPIPTAAQQGPASSGESARQKHLDKAQPTQLKNGGNQAQDVNLGATDPNLRPFKGQHQGGGFSGLLKNLILVIILLILIVGVLFVFVEPVRDALLPLLPANMQEPFLESSAPASASSASEATKPAEGAQ